ncbi:hypothetical protein D3C87_2119280 [compost metagenome]
MKPTTSPITTVMAGSIMAVSCLILKSISLSENETPLLASSSIWPEDSPTAIIWARTRGK